MNGLAADGMRDVRCQPVVIIAAPRSGTNLLRNLVASWPGCGTWPCDELPLLWRYRNSRHPSDEFSRDMARPEVKAYIRAAFDRLARRRDLDLVVEKTCANSLRVGFVDEVLPEARFVWLVRDGVDATASAIRRRSGSVSLRYVLRKARYAPVRELPAAALRFLHNRFRRLFAADRQVRTWGPAFEGMTDAARRMEAHEVCALQWARCNDRALAELREIEPGRVHALEYERLVTDPAETLGRLAGFLGVDPVLQGAAVRAVRPDGVGRGRRRLGPRELERVEAIVAPTRERISRMLES